VNVVIRDSVDTEHLPSVTNVGKLFTIPFLLTSAKTITVSILISITE